MNILAINPVNLKQNINSEKVTNTQRQNSYGLTMSKPLAADTVSFGEKIFTPKKATVLDFITSKELKLHKELQEPAATFLKVLEAISLKLAHLGVEFDVAYCSKKPVKDVNRCIEKMVGSGSLDIRDRLRASLFVKDIYNMDILNEIFRELDEWNYKLHYDKVPLEDALEAGYRPTEKDLKKKNIKLPDLDMRLDRSRVDEEKIPRELKHCLSHPQATGYEDIQFRVEKGGNLHEIIILMGKNYAKAKDEDSKYIYSRCRKFKELNFTKQEENNPNLIAAKGYIEAIKTMFREISTKLFANAKQKDHYNTDTVRPLEFKLSEFINFNTYFVELENCVQKYYNDKKLEATTKGAKAVLSKELEKDLEKLQKIRSELDESLKHFQEQKEND